MATKFKYNLETLEWDEQHVRNKEGVYCYCGMDYNEGDPMLQCADCNQLFHWDCVSCLKAKPLRGDIFYRFKCNVCNEGKGEEYEREVLSWVQVIYLVLYHLSKEDPKRSYFRWRENICQTIGDNWEGLFPDKKKTATWQNTVAGCLSTHSALFKSGMEETQQSGNWALHEVAAPTRDRFRGPTKPGGRQRAGQSRRRDGAEKEILEVLGESKKRGGARHRVSFSDDEDDEDDRRRVRRAKRKRIDASKALAEDSELLQSVELFTQLQRQQKQQQQQNGTDEAVKAEDGLDVLDECSSLSSWSSEASEGSKSSLEKQGRAQTGSTKNKEAAEGTKSAQNSQQSSKVAQPISSSNETSSPTKRTENSHQQLQSENARLDSVQAIRPSQALAEAIAARPLFAPEEQASAALQPLSERMQWDISERIGASRQAMGVSAARRLRRRLQLRRLRRILGLPQFDIDRVVGIYMAHRQQAWDPAGTLGDDSRALVGRSDGYGAQHNAGENDDSRAQQGTLAASAGATTPADEKIKVTTYAHSFASRLLGRAVLRDNLTAAGPQVSPFHGRLLRPFIWRDTRAMPASSSELPMLQVLRSIRAREHRVFQRLGYLAAEQPQRETIDYVHFQRGHLAQVNALLCQTFWPSIDMSEALQYPEFSIVALYKRRVVGCAFLTPDAYLTYVAVAAGWEAGGIAKYMVYYLTQTVPTKDVTLHVAATNVAMLLYQQLGFKPETYAPGFYKAYLPESSRVCPNAFFMRLRRY
ncbi:hypothetical protein EV183_002906 [Coemansia sp. RSA 2336]|nr:hypothetical protein EV183_002906 [Coemansia sp. RSA 2336]